MSAIVPATSVEPVEQKAPPRKRATITVWMFGALNNYYRERETFMMTLTHKAIITSVSMNMTDEIM